MEQETVSGNQNDKSSSSKIISQNSKKQELGKQWRQTGDLFWNKKEDEHGMI